MTIGTFLTALSLFGFMISYSSWHIYLSQVIHALGMAMLVPPWYAIFSRHVDKDKEAFEWGTDSTVLGFGAGIMSAVGGVLVGILGFRVIFFLAGIINLISALLLFVIRKEISPKENIPHPVPPSKIF